MVDTIKEMGTAPWHIYRNQEDKLVGVISDDFDHDVVLYVN